MRASRAEESGTRTTGPHRKWTPTSMTVKINHSGAFWLCQTILVFFIKYKKRVLAPWWAQLEAKSTLFRSLYCAHYINIQVPSSPALSDMTKSVTCSFCSPFPGGEEMQSSRGPWNSQQLGREIPPALAQPPHTEHALAMPAWLTV